ncbi:SRPBCC family protein [Sorangium sp. So ce296]|uniref:ATPase n=2 Tax=Sorangium cellulosum TaxID=56 RepID=A0A150PMH4_SORCE|nr:SRPBCC family protein [Sorangium cellulosum]AGP32646.1 ATPase [Sorangium cellulosum So0157-2]KYF56766.1 ATPase [Sorangium cellulosum]
MVATSAANKDSFQVTTPSEQEIHMTRLFNAPRHLVFEAMTRPEHVKRWWGCLGEGYGVSVCEIDLRPGGAWRFVNRHPHGEAAFHGEYKEITPPSRLVYTEIFEMYPDTVSLVTSVLTEEGGKTRVTTTTRYPSKEVRDAVIASGMEHGAALSYDRLEDLVAQLQQR